MPLLEEILGPKVRLFDVWSIGTLLSWTFAERYDGSIRRGGALAQISLRNERSCGLLWEAIERLLTWSKGRQNRGSRVRTGRSEVD